MKMAALLLLVTAVRFAPAFEVKRYDEIPNPGFSVDDLRLPPVPERQFSWWPSISPGWPLLTGKWTLKWGGTF